MGLSFVFQQENDPKHLQAVQGQFDQEGEWWRAASDDLASTITRPQPNWDSLGWVGPQSEGKAANKCSAYVGTPSRLLEKHSRWNRLRECQECAKLTSKQRVATLKNLKYYIYFDLFNTFLVTTWFHMCYFTVLMSSLLFYNVENSLNKIKKLEWAGVQTFDWYCTFSLSYLHKLPHTVWHVLYEIVK